MDMMSLRRRVMVNQNKLMTATGNPLMFNTPLAKPLKECVARFTPQQEGSGTPSPENVRPIVGKNGITVWQSNKGVFHNLPSAYQEAEYLEGTGTQKIDTGIVIDDSNFNISCRFVLPEYYGKGEYPVFSIWRSTPNYFNCFVRVVNSKMSVYTAGHHLPNTTIIEEGVINDIALSRTDTTWTFTHNEETIDWTYSPTTSNDTTLKVFTRGDGKAASHIRVYSLTVEVEGELVGDFVPCYRKSDSVAGLYDLVTKTFFTNYADDTNFVVGEDIVGVETSVSFPAVGKNLFDGEWRKGRYVDGEWTATNTWRTSELIPVEPNTTYCVSVNEPRTIGKIYSNLFDRNGNWIGSDYGTSVTTTVDTVLMTICNTKNVVSAWTDIQLEKGSTATAYEPFDNTVYGGYVDLVNGEVVAEWAEWIEDGSRNIPYWPWSKSTDGNSVFALFKGLPSDVQRIATATDKQKINLCENRSYYDINAIRNQTNPYVFGVYSVSALSYAVGYPTGLIGETKAELQTYLAEHPEKFIYKLANPIHYPIPPHILTTLTGNNVMWSDGNELTVKYWTR